MQREIYQENIIDHYQNPKNNGSIKNSDIHLRELNPLCGDEIEIFANIAQNKIKEIKFQGKGCAISQAAASILLSEIEGKSVNEIKKISSEKMIKMMGISLNPVRMKCAILALKTLEKGINDYEVNKNARN